MIYHKGDRGNFKFYLITAWIVLGLLIIPNLISAANYSVSLQKGSTRYKVASYDKDAWNETISDDFGPEEYFGENANITNAESKYVIRSWYDITYNTSEVFFSLLIPQEKIFLLSQFNITNLYIDENYTKIYDLNFILTAKWNFNTSILPENATFPSAGLFIFENPGDFKILLDDYNSFANEINDNFSVPVPLDLISEEELIFDLFRTRFGIAAPIDTYLEEMTNSLDSENVTSDGNTLKLKLNGKESYSVEVSFGDNGLQSSITFLDSDDKVIYEIITYETEWTVWIILAIVALVIVAIVGYAIFRRRKRQKKFQESLERIES